MEAQLEAQLAAHNRHMALQLTTEATAVSLTNDVILHDFAQAVSITGPEAVTAVLHTFFQNAFTDSTIEISALLADKATVALSLSINGRQMAPFWGLPWTGRSISLSLVILCHFHGDKIARIELFYDAGTLLRQLGLAL